MLPLLGYIQGIILFAFAEATLAATSHYFKQLCYWIILHSRTERILPLEKLLGKAVSTKNLAIKDAAMLGLGTSLHTENNGTKHFVVDICDNLAHFVVDINDNLAHFDITELYSSNRLF